MIAESEQIFHEDCKRAWDRGLVKRINTLPKMYENNVFENYFNESDVR